MNFGKLFERCSINIPYPIILLLIEILVISQYGMEKFFLKEKIPMKKRKEFSAKQTLAKG